MAKPIKQKNGNYLHRIRVKHPLTGKWINKQTTAATMKECRDWEARTRADTLDGISVEKVKLTTFFDLWYTTFQEKRISEGRKNKVLSTKAYLVLHFGENFLLANMDKIKYQNFLNFLSEQTVYSISATKKSRSKKTLSQTTIKDYHKVAKAMFDEAIDLGYIRSNPTRNAIILGRDASLERKKTLTREEWRKLLEAVLNAENSSSKFATVTMMFLGVRFQEVCGLTIADIDFKNNVIKVDKAFDYKKAKEFTATKTAGSVRNVDMPETLAIVLKSYIASLQSSKVVALEKRSAFLFPNELGVPITNSAINKFITKRCKAAKIERVTSHAFRHAKTDMLVLAGADIIYTQMQLGHRDPNTTLRYYSALNEDIRIKNKSIQDDFLNDVINK